MTPGACLQQSRHVGSGLDDLLHVVQHQQEVAVAQGTPEGLRRRYRAVQPDAEHATDRGQHRLRVADGIQWHEGDFASGPGHAVGDLEGDARLADPAGADQRHQACSRIQQAAHLCRLGLSTHQVGQGLRELMAARPPERFGALDVVRSLTLRATRNRSARTTARSSRSSRSSSSESRNDR